MSDTKDVLDLDALVPPTAIVKFGGKEIEVQPPKTGDLLRLGSLGRKIENLADADDKQVEELVNEMTGLIKRVIPELSDAELTTQQLLGLVGLIGKMATPPEAKELEAKGITPAGDTNPKA